MRQEDGSYVPRIKISENPEKITNPGKKILWRIYDNDTRHGFCDVLTLNDEEIIDGVPFDVKYPTKPWKEITLTNFHAEKLQVTIFDEGKLVYKKPSLQEIRDYVQKQLRDSVWIEEQRLQNPHIHYTDLSVKLYQLKEDLLENNHKS